MTEAKTLYDKIWDAHVVDEAEDGTCLLYIDRHLIHEVTSAQAFEGLRDAGRPVHAPNRTIATPDHNVPTDEARLKVIEDEQSRIQVEALANNTKEFGIEHFGISDIRQGIVHIVGPEQGYTLPGMTVVCGDSHTATHGAFGSIAHGIGTSEVEHVLATQTLIQKKSRNMKVEVTGTLATGVTPKDVALSIIGATGTGGGTGHVIEYCGQVFRDMSMEGRMTVCNMAIEGGARAGMVAPDQTTFDYVRGRPNAPKGEEFERAVAWWKTLYSDDDAHWDKVVTLKGEDIPPVVTWGTSPEDVVPITEMRLECVIVDAVDLERIKHKRRGEGGDLVLTIGKEFGTPAIGGVLIIAQPRKRHDAPAHRVDLFVSLNAFQHVSRRQRCQLALIVARKFCAGRFQPIQIAREGRIVFRAVKV